MEIKEKKVEKAVEALSNVNKENGDIFDVTAILIDDIADLYRSKDKLQFRKQRSDLYKTFKTLRKMIRNINYNTDIKK